MADTAEVRKRNPNPKEYFYAMTVQWSPHAGAMGYKQMSGTYVTNRVTTRLEAFAEIIKMCAAQVGYPAEKMIVVFFALEPNEL